MSDYLGNRKWLAVAGYGLGAIDRVGEGVRGAPRDALVADLIRTEAK